MTRKEYEDLKTVVQKNFELYNTQDAPEISDYEYDMMMQQLKSAEKEHPEWIDNDSPTQNPGTATKREAGVDVTHNVPMLSIEDVFTKEDVLEWTKKVRSVYPDAKFCVEHKIDGLSMTMRYQDGSLSLAETRGTGYVGEDVTENARQIPDVLKKIQETDYLEVRGEVYMTRDNFEGFNVKQELEGRKLAANPRNLAAGTLRQLDSSVVKERGLNIFIFNVQAGAAKYMETQTEGLKKLKEMGFTPVYSTLCTTDDEILAEIDKIAENRGSFAYDIDGAVVKIDQIEYRKSFPSAAKYGAGMIAYKYPPEEKETTLLDVQITVGRTGRIAPTAIFEPIHLCGTTVSKCTLNNQDFINDLDIGIGDSLIIYKSGEIIPTCKGVNKAKRKADWVRYKLPETCPVCGGPIEKKINADDSEGLLFCVNPECPSKQLQMIVHFASREAMDIDGISEKTVEKLLDLKLIKNALDLYDLTEEKLSSVLLDVDGWAKKAISNLVASIEKSKNTSLARLINALGISGIGKDQAKVIAETFDYDKDAFFDALEDVWDFTSVYGIGDTINNSLCSWYKEKYNDGFYEQLKEVANTFTFEVPQKSSNSLEGKTFVITGSVEHFANRDEIKAFIESNGGKTSGSVSAKTSYLVNNDVTSTSGKNKKAKDLNIPIISEEDLLAMM